MFERALRRAGLKPSFSAGYHPLPQISFGRALPVGVSSMAEWMAIFLREPSTPEEFGLRLNPNLPEGLAVVGGDVLPPGRKIPHPELETFDLTVPEELAATCLEQWREFTAAVTFPVVWTSKKGERSLDARPLVRRVETVGPATVRFMCSFAEQTYVSPLRLAEAVCPQLVRGRYALSKVQVAFAPEGPAFPARLDAVIL